MILRKRWMRVAATLGVAALGGSLAALLGLPVAWLLGGTVFVAGFVLLGQRADVPSPLRNAAFFLLGIQAGSGVTPAVLHQLVLWPASFAMQMLGVVGVVWLTFLFLKRLGWDRETALFAAIPGALSFVLAAANDTRADMTKIIVVQCVRLLLLIGVLVPTLGWLESGTGTVGAARAPDGPLYEYAILGVLCFAGAYVGVRSRVPGGLILGSLVVSAILHATEIATVGLPVFIAIPALVVLGGVIGGRLRPEDRSALRTLAPAAFGAFAIGIAASSVAGLAAAKLLGFEIGKVALAYAPGALEALTVLAFQFDLDPAYVAAHHVVRFIALALLVPLFARRLPRREVVDAAAHDTTAAPDGDRGD